ncbi:malate dehydrogenase, cytoplasmic-like [Agrilus planipennis]|uniref:Malate dehydrogenase, cytoplasmic n=1 Tax=Agrilus planipennis TaxID=224129 RepID=A0A1W4X261_AGRPL|nr:malate dehydrogenase, cytoplasmic-like [Agrilus planipennis]
MAQADKCQRPLRVLITAAAGHVAYSLVFMIAKGACFGPKVPIVLILYDVPENQDSLHGLAVELNDCCYPLLNGIEITPDIQLAFGNFSVAYLLASSPHKPGIQRGDLIEANAPEFKSYGEALEKYSRKNVKVIVYGDCMNTNLFICSKYAPSMPQENFTTVAQLNINRVKAQVALKLGVPPTCVRNVIVWGNDSSTTVCDISKAKVIIDENEVKVKKAIDDCNWIQHELPSIVQRREDDIVDCQEKSAGISAAKALAQHTRFLFSICVPRSYICMGVFSDGSYGVPCDVVSFFPVCIEDCKWTINKNLSPSQFIRDLIILSGCELEQERDKALAILEG